MRETVVQEESLDSLGEQVWQATESIFDVITIDEKKPVGSPTRYGYPMPLEDISNFKRYLEAEVRLSQFRAESGALGPQERKRARARERMFFGAQLFLADAPGGGRTHLAQVTEELYLGEHNAARNYEKHISQAHRPGEPSPFDQPEVQDKINKRRVRANLVIAIEEKVLGSRKPRL